MRQAQLKALLIDWLAALTLFGLALWLRAANLNHFVTADEHNWLYRSGIFLRALLQADLPATSVWYTPAVTTTWLGSAGLAIHYYLHQPGIDRPFMEWLVAFSRNKIDLEVLLALRWAMALFTAAMVGVVYGLARKLWSRPVALLGALLLLTEPHLLAVSRIIGHDAPLTFFTAASLLAFFYARRQLINRRPSQSRNKNLTLTPPPPLPVWKRGRRASDGGEGEYTLFSGKNLMPYGWFALSGLFTGLAILSKAPALILLPFAGLAALLDVAQNKNRLKPWLAALLVWGLVTWLTFILVWPAAWVNPLGQSWFVISTAFLSSAGLEDADVQPYWSIPDPGYFYYLLNGAFKISPFLMIGLILAAVGGWLALRRRGVAWPRLLNSELLWLGLFALLFGLMMTLGVKRSPRYILPAFPALAFVAAWGWLRLPLQVKPALLIAGLGLLAVGLTLNYAPYYFTYYNPLLGGSLTAPHWVRVGWGEGLDELGRWLSRQPTALADRVGARYTATLYPFYPGQLASPTSKELDYVAFYIKQTQSGEPAPEILAYFQQYPPLHRVTLNGIEYAQLYPGPAMQPVEKRAGTNLPIAYRPHTIYAPIGGNLTVDLLWPLDAARRGPVTLALALEDGEMVWESKAEIANTAPGVRVSRHHFSLPADTARQSYTLTVDGQRLGRLKARLMDIPADYEPLSVVMAGQLKLAGIRQQVEGDHLQVDLAWQGWPQAVNDYTVFVQLLDENEQRLAGVDVAPEPGFTTLERKEVRLTHYHLPLPDNRPPGKYRLLVGLYYFAADELINVGAAVLESPVVIN